MSIPEGAHERIEKFKDRLNFSEIFREAAIREIENIQSPGPILDELRSYLEKKILEDSGTRISSLEENRLRQQERDRFEELWGPIKESEQKETAFSPWVAIRKVVTLETGNETALALKVFNKVGLAEWVMSGGLKLNKFNEELWRDVGNGKLAYVIDFFESKGLKVGELGRVTRKLFAELETDGLLGQADRIIGQTRIAILLATNGKDVLYFGYRKE